MYPKILPEVRGGAQRAEGSVVEGKLLYYCLINRTKEASRNGDASFVLFMNLEM